MSSALFVVSVCRGRIHLNGNNPIACEEDHKRWREEDIQTIIRRVGCAGDIVGRVLDIAGGDVQVAIDELMKPKHIHEDLTNV